MENDVQSLMNIFQKVENINFEYLKNPHQGNFLFIRDDRYVVRFVFDAEDNLAAIKVVNLDVNEVSKKED